MSRILRYDYCLKDFKKLQQLMTTLILMFFLFSLLIIRTEESVKD